MSEHVPNRLVFVCCLFFIMQRFNLTLELGIQALKYTCRCRNVFEFKPFIITSRFEKYFMLDTRL